VAIFTPRKHTRLKGFDYSQPAAYFITVCAHRQRCIFGGVAENHIRLSKHGSIVKDTWLALPQHYSYISLDAFIVMPNHIHGILIYTCTVDDCRRVALPNVVGSLKSYSTRAINKLRSNNTPPVWQRSFYEHAIRPEEDINDYRQYIMENPLKWHLDELNVNSD
jgi:putative transposase